MASLIALFALLVSFGSLAFVGFNFLQQIKVTNVAYRPYVDIVPLAFNSGRLVNLGRNNKGIIIETRYKIVNLGQVPAVEIIWKVELLAFSSKLCQINKSHDFKATETPIIPLHRGRSFVARNSNTFSGNSKTIDRLIADFNSGNANIFMGLSLNYRGGIKQQDPFSTRYIIEIKEGGARAEIQESAIS